MAVSNEVKLWRKAQRAEVQLRRATMSAAQRREWNMSITRFLANEFAITHGMVVGLY